MKMGATTLNGTWMAQTWACIRVAFWVCALGTGISLAPAAASHGGELEGKPEYEARAAFLILLSKYTQWPEALPGDFIIGVVGDDPFGSTLDVFEGAFIHGRKVQIRRFRDAYKVSPCHLLYFSASEEKRLAAARERLGRASALTVGESAGFLSMGGGLRLFTEAGHLRFEVNLRLLENSNIRIEAKVLRLAKQVH